MTASVLDIAIGVAVGAPLVAAVLLTLCAWSGRRLPERLITAAVGSAFSLSFAGTLAAVAALSATAAHQRVIEVGTWFAVGEYRFDVSFVADELSLPFGAFSSGLVGLVAAFSARYLHREPGFQRFYLLLAWFGAGVTWVSYAGGLDVAFPGWEVVGLTSALLIGFFEHRFGPVRNGLRAFATYRFCDAAFLAAIVWLHHATGSTAYVSGSPWRGLAPPESHATIAAVLLVVASLGKAAQVPIGGWLPRAMEGPTPSSAIFYGALSVHLGPLLMLRAAPLIEHSTAASALLIGVGAATALHGTFVGRVQTDIKSALAYASMTQVGLIMLEVGLGLRYVALAHIVGHASLRTLQILRSPNILHDHHHLELAMRGHLPRTGAHLERLVPRAWQPWLYRHALERGYFDSALSDLVIAPIRSAVARLEDIEARWLDWVAGEGRAPSGGSVAPSATAETGAER